VVDAKTVSRTACSHGLSNIRCGTIYRLNYFSNTDPHTRSSLIEIRRWMRTLCSRIAWLHFQKKVAGPSGLTSVLHSGMSLKHYSERRSLRENAKQVSENVVTSRMPHVINFTFSFDVSLAFWNGSKTLWWAKWPQRKNKAGERTNRNFPHASRHELHIDVGLAFWNVSDTL